MSRGSPTWVGADPGGVGAFGVAILRAGSTPELTTVNCADEAVAFVVDRLAYAPHGVGIDAPMWWSSGRSSDRRADQQLRVEYGLTGGQVQTSNSLRGAALVQGAMFVQRIREQFPRVPVTEVHPKAVLHAKPHLNWSGFAQQYGIEGELRVMHERDALIAAIAAREGFEGRWTRDLSLDRGPSEQDPSTYWLAPVQYFWPAE